jgi:hypothetical protein
VLVMLAVCGCRGPSRLRHGSAAVLTISLPTTT